MVHYLISHCSCTYKLITKVFSINVHNKVPLFHCSTCACLHRFITESYHSNESEIVAIFPSTEMTEILSQLLGRKRIFEMISDQLRDAEIPFHTARDPYMRGRIYVNNISGVDVIYANYPLAIHAGNLTIRILENSFP